MDTCECDGIAKHWYQLGGEFCDASVATLPDGDVLFFGNQENEMRVYRVSGTIHIKKPAPAGIRWTGPNCGFADIAVVPAGALGTCLAHAPHSLAGGWRRVPQNRNDWWKSKAGRR